MILEPVVLSQIRNVASYWEQALVFNTKYNSYDDIFAIFKYLKWPSKV